MPRRRVKKEPQTRPTSCIVCGEAAAGYNYGGASCSRCKTFFRRAIIDKRVYNGCLRSGACERGEAVRLCRSCRYDRCLRGGMNPLLVSGADFSDANATNTGSGSDDTEQPSTSSATSGSRQRKVLSKNASVECQTDRSKSPPDDVPCDPDNDSRSSESRELRLVPNPLLLENKLENIMQNLLILEDAHQKLRISKYTPKIVPGLSIDDFAPGPSKMGVEFGPMHSQPYVPSSVKLVPIEVLIKRRVQVDLSNFDYVLKKLWLFQDKVYAVEYIKALPVYNLLDESSKKVLLASALLTANFTASFYSYTHHSDRVSYPDGSVMTWDSEMHKQSPGSTRFYTGIITAIREAELDTREYTLLKNIIICNPLLDGIHPYDITLLQLEKERCTKALLSYVLARRGSVEGPAYFAKILSIVDVLTTLTSWQKGQCLLFIALGLFKNRTPFSETMYHSH